MADPLPPRPGEHPPQPDLGKPGGMPASQPVLPGQPNGPRPTPQPGEAPRPL